MAKRGPLPGKFSSRTQRKQNTASQPTLQDRKFGPAIKPSNMEKYERELWAELAEPLRQAGVLDSLSAVLFRAMCSCHALMRMASDELLRDGSTRKNWKGRIVKHPAAATYATFARHFRAFAVMFGLPQPSRARIPVSSETAPGDELAEFLERKGVN